MDIACPQVADKKASTVPCVSRTVGVLQPWTSTWGVQSRCTITGSKICAFFLQILLDKLLAVWYNGNSRCWGVGGAQKSPYGVSTGVVAYVVGIGPTLFQHRGLWFTFVFRTPTHHAVGSWGEVLCSSRGLLGLVSCPRWLSLRVASPSPFVPLLYHAFAGLSRTFFISS